MARKKAKVEEAPEDLWEYYKSIQLTPEQKAAARARMEAQCEEAARNRIWERFLELEGKVHATVEEASEDLSAYYKSIQVTPEQREEARARMEQEAEEAGRNGVYEGLLSLMGKVHFDMDELRRLREDDD